MGVLKLNIPASNNTNATVPGTPKVQSKLWLNVGYEINGRFVSLPFGLPIDTMNPAKITGQNPEFVKPKQAGNDLLEALQRAGADMAPGQEEEVQLTVRLRRVNEELDIPKEENEYAIDLASLFAPKPTSTTEPSAA